MTRKAAPALEQELKFDLSREALERLSVRLAGDAQTVGLHSTYFDTPDHDLKAAGYGLRVRREAGGAFIQTLKRQDAANPTLRKEWEAPLEDDNLSLVHLRATPLDALLEGRFEQLAPVFSLSVQRLLHQRPYGVSRIDLALDHGEITAGARREAICELELELKSGQLADLYGLARELSKSEPLFLAFESKAARGYALAAEPPAAAFKGRLRLAKAVTVAQALIQIGWTCLGQVATNAKLVRRRGAMEALHQARVGLRRFRAALTAFKPMIGGQDFETLKRETKWLAGELDAARDLDIFIQDTFTAATPSRAERPAFAKLGMQLLGDQTRAYRRACDALKSPRYADLLLDAAAWLETGAWRSPKSRATKAMLKTPARIFAAQRLQRLRHTVLKRARGFGRLDEAGRHQLRIAGKKLRYAADFFSGVFGESGRGAQARFGKRLAQLQDNLGALNDIAVAHDLAANLARDHVPEIGLAAGLAVGSRGAEQTERLKAARKALDRFREVKPFWS